MIGDDLKKYAMLKCYLIYYTSIYYRVIIYTFVKYHLKVYKLKLIIKRLIRVSRSGRKKHINIISYKTNGTQKKNLQ